MGPSPTRLTHTDMCMYNILYLCERKDRGERDKGTNLGEAVGDEVRQQKGDGDGQAEVRLARELEDDDGGGDGARDARGEGGGADDWFVVLGLVRC